LIDLNSFFFKILTTARVSAKNLLASLWLLILFHDHFGNIKQMVLPLFNLYFILIHRLNIKASHKVSMYNSWGNYFDKRQKFNMDFFKTGGNGH